jgi:hypothetical protein
MNSLLLFTTYTSRYLQRGGERPGRNQPVAPEPAVCSDRLYLDSSEEEVGGKGEGAGGGGEGVEGGNNYVEEEEQSEESIEDGGNNDPVYSAPRETRLLLSRNVLRDRGNNDVEGEEDGNQTVVLLLLTIIVAFIRNITTRIIVFTRKRIKILITIFRTIKAGWCTS